MRTECSSLDNLPGQCYPKPASYPGDGEMSGTIVLSSEATTQWRRGAEWTTGDKFQSSAAASARVQMTNVTVARLRIFILEGYADISTVRSAQIVFLSKGSACISGGTLASQSNVDDNVVGMIMARSTWLGHVDFGEWGMPIDAGANHGMTPTDPIEKNIGS